jgi:hypothetical protein
MGRSNPRFLRKQNGDDYAKENSHRTGCSANCSINRASGGCLRMSSCASERLPGVERAIPQQQCLCRTRLCCGAIALAATRRRNDGVGASWSLICDASTKAKESGTCRTLSGSAHDSLSNADGPATPGFAEFVAETRKQMLECRSKIDRRPRRNTEGRRTG